MARGVSELASVAHKLCDLLLQFPSAAIEGVRWQVLIRRFEERHCTKLNLTSLGFDSPLTAAAALLWEVASIRDAKDVQNPVLALECGVALTPRPGCMGCWPSLYKCLSEIVLKEKSADAQPSILLSQLKPLLQAQWHASIDEHWGYLDGKGTSVKTKKMKHLIQAVLKWRNQRVRGDSGAKAASIDEVLVPELELVPSTKHNDLILRAVVAVSPPCSGIRAPAGAEGKVQCESWADATDADMEDADILSSVSPCPYDDPFEPPPQKANWELWDSTPSTMCSTPTHPAPYSGSSTPVSQQAQATYAFMPMPMMLCQLVSSAGSAFSDVCAIPSGTVRQLRTQIEGAGTAAPVTPASQWAWK